MVRYGVSQRPKTPIRSNWLRCRSTYFSAYSRQARRTASGSISSFLRPSFSSTLISIGSPWQSHPGTYGASNPAIVFVFTTKSLMHLLSACPRWIAPFAYGGPSCRIYFAAPGAGLADLGIQMLLLPCGQAFRLILRQIRLHREGRLRQVQGRLQRFRFGFLVFGLFLGCSGHSFLVFMVAELQLTPNSYCSRPATPKTKRKSDIPMGVCVQDYERRRVKLCRMFPGSQTALAAL